MILVGEMRDMETIETALHAAETGHLVFSTLHTLDATETINRIISVFPPHQQKQVRLQLAVVLKAAVAMRLIPRADGNGRAPALEVLVATPFIKDCIIDKEKTHLIQGAIAQGTSQYGMQTFDQSIFNLYSQDIITYDEALRWASNVDEFKLRVQGISTTSDQARDQMAGTLFSKPAAAPKCDARDHALLKIASRPDAYTAALVMLGQRELSEAQVRTRLARRGCDADAITDALERLKRDRTLDDGRVARAAARLEAGIRHRGPARVRQRLQSMGLADDVVRRP